MTLPWRQPQALADAMELACNVRDYDPVVCEQALWLWEPERVIKTLMAAAALVDVERTRTDLLAWDRLTLVGTCKRGHPRTAATTRVDANGSSLRCRVCERDRRAELRRGAKRIRVRRVRRGAA